MKYHTLSISKLGKISQKLSSAAVVISTLRVNFKIWLKGYKLVFMLNSTAHKIDYANKY